MPRMATIRHVLKAAFPAGILSRHKIIRCDQLCIERQYLQHGVIVLIGEAAGAVFQKCRGVAHVDGAFDRRLDNMLDTLSGDIEVGDSVGAQDQVQIGTFETVLTNSCHDDFAVARNQLVDHVSAP